MNLYEIKRISDRFILIGERIGQRQLFSMYLVIGEEKAALVDAGMGTGGDLDQVVGQLTDKPVMVLSTHADPDHIGSNILFDEIYLSRLDEGNIDVSLDRENRMSDLWNMSGNDQALYEYAREHMTGETHFEYHDIADGQMFELGGVCLEAIAVPGHTPGSMCFLNREDSYVLTGDAVNPYPWMWLDRCTNMDTYLNALIRFREKTEGIADMYCGHSQEPLPEGLTEELITAVRELTRGMTDGDVEIQVPVAGKRPDLKVMGHRHGQCMVCYNPERI